MILNKNADITLYNRFVDKGIYKYQRTAIEGVNWQIKRSATVTDKGLLSADSILIFIDKINDKTYVGPKEFQRLTNKTNYFTLSKDDIIVKGIIDYEITEVNTIKKLQSEYDDVINIISVAEWSNHFEVGGK